MILVKISVLVLEIKRHHEKTSEINSGRIKELASTNLKGLNLSNAKLENTDLSNANFTDANLQNANLTHSNLSHVNFCGADLAGANLIGANLFGIKIDDKTNFTNTILTGKRHYLKFIQENPLDTCLQLLLDYTKRSALTRNFPTFGTIPHYRTVKKVIFGLQKKQYHSIIEVFNAIQKLSSSGIKPTESLFKRLELAAHLNSEDLSSSKPQIAPHTKIDLIV